jgi:hypothetical protein
MVTGSSFLLGGLMTLGAATAEVMTGATSVTVTDVMQEFMFPDASVAVQVTGVEPNPKVEPELGMQLAVTAGQLSENVGVTVTAAPEELVQLTEVGAGQEMFGFWVSFTVTFAEQYAEAWSGPLSTTDRVTGVVPSAYGPAGVCVAVTPSPSGSKEPLLMDAVELLHRLKSVETMVEEHSASGSTPIVPVMSANAVVDGVAQEAFTPHGV